MATRARTARANPGKVVLGVCGSIAAYKACLVVRGLTKAGVAVKVVMTPSAERFVTPLTLGTLSRGPVFKDLFDPQLWDMAHLSLASWADLVLIAPATADCLARLAAGRAGGLLEGLVLAASGGNDRRSPRPVALCPAMDTEMWEHPATRGNVERLASYGYSIWGPASGDLASGRVGMGRLLEPDDIVRRALDVLKTSRRRR